MPELIKFVGARLATGAIEILGLPLLYYIGMKSEFVWGGGICGKNSCQCCSCFIELCIQ